MGTNLSLAVTFAVVNASAHSAKPRVICLNIILEIGRKGFKCCFLLSDQGRFLFYRYEFGSEVCEIIWMIFPREDCKTGHVAGYNFWHVKFHFDFSSATGL